LGKKLNQGSEEHPRINSHADAAALVHYGMSQYEQEYRKVLLLDTRNRLIKIMEVCHGLLNMKLVRVGKVFKSAVQCMAHGIILVNNLFI
jgi:DNA repair protein RadC